MPNIKQTHHHDRALAIVQLLVGRSAMSPEFSVPIAKRRVDAVFEVGTPHSAWGILRDAVADRALALEHFSSPPSMKGFARLLAKLALINDYWRNQQRFESALRRPLLLVLSDGDPGSVRRARPALDAGACAGLWLEEHERLGDTLIVDVNALDPDVPGTALWRFVPAAHGARARATIRALLADRETLGSKLEELQEAIMDGTISATPEEKKTLVQKLREQGVALGRRQGVLDIAERVLGPDTAAQLAGIEDIEELERRVAALLAR